MTSPISQLLLQESNEIPGLLHTDDFVFCPSCGQLRVTLLGPAEYWWLREGLPQAWRPAICNDCFEEFDALAARRDQEGDAPNMATVPHPDSCATCGQLTAATSAIGTTRGGYEASYVCQLGHEWKTWWAWHLRLDPRTLMVMIDEGDCWYQK